MQKAQPAPFTLLCSSGEKGEGEHGESFYFEVCGERVYHYHREKSQATPQDSDGSDLLLKPPKTRHFFTATKKTDATLVHNLLFP